VTLRVENGEVIHCATPITWAEMPRASQFSLTKAEWQLSMLNGATISLAMADFQVFKTIKVVSPTGYAITKHLLWVVRSDGVLTAQFIAKDGEACEIGRDCVSVSILDARKDQVIVHMKGRIVLASVNSTQTELFDRLIKEEKYDQITYLGDGLGFEVTKELRTSMHRYIEEGNLTGALEIIERAPVDVKDSLLRVLQTGCHLLAMHIALRFPGYDRALPFLVNTIALKYEIFQGFMFQFTKLFKQKEFLERRDMPVSPSLRFRNAMHDEVEDSDLVVLQNASKLDFSQSIVLAFSQAYSALLNQLYAMRDTTEENMPLPGCIELCRWKEGWTYLGIDGNINLECNRMSI
jgi:hypothetical protein